MRYGVGRGVCFELGKSVSVADEGEIPLTTPRDFYCLCFEEKGAGKS
jgi:hypothetical protein